MKSVSLLWVYSPLKPPLSAHSPCLASFLCRAHFLPLIVLLIKKAVRIETPLAALAGSSLAAVAASWLGAEGTAASPFYYILSGGFLFAASVMAGDPVTSPLRQCGRILYEMLFGALFCGCFDFFKGGYLPIFLGTSLQRSCTRNQPPFFPQQKRERMISARIFADVKRTPS